ncbi:hypothetical protein SLEP1_g36725 [Rubroshorea leprosula]|uniref:Uncharacterized protein n=1 Tax=Rubroshorea leprosula TaxID=152421 RepID=A0AAV5KSX2_9ROSI|nr:hypothetical protein SLEP1_g36725 [Rubroshorea leprosula]
MNWVKWERVCKEKDEGRTEAEARGVAVQDTWVSKYSKGGHYQVSLAYKSMKQRVQCRRKLQIHVGVE